MADDIYCERCGEQLVPDRIVWLELNGKTHRFERATKSTISEEDSQGCFPYGSTCARKVLKEQRNG